MPLRRSLRHRELTIAATASLLVCWQAGARAQSDGFPLPLAFPHQPPAKPVSPPQRTGPEVPAPAAPGTRYEPQSQVQTKPMRVEVIACGASTCVLPTKRPCLAASRGRAGPWPGHGS
jgi:hypothetical protein